MTPPAPGPAGAASQPLQYSGLAEEYGPALARLASAYELRPECRKDLLQEIHIALWRSLAMFDRRCSIRTWVYRVAHNVAATHVHRHRRLRREQLFSLEELDAMADPAESERRLDEGAVLDRLGKLIQTLRLLDRDIILLYLEGVEAAGIADIVGLSPANIATKIHRIKALLMRRFHAGGRPHA